MRLEGRLTGGGWAWADVEIRGAEGVLARTRHRAAARLVVDDGTEVELELAGTEVTRARREQRKGTWAALQKTDLGGLVSLEAGPHVRVELVCTGLRAGDRVAVEGEVLERHARDYRDYRASAAGSPRRVRVVSMASLERDSVLLTDTAPAARSSSPRRSDTWKSWAAQAAWPVLAALHLCAFFVPLPDTPAECTYARAGWLALGVTALVHVLTLRLGAPVPRPELVPAFVPVAAEPTSMRHVDPRGNGAVPWFVFVGWFVFVVVGLLPSGGFLALHLQSLVDPSIAASLRREALGMPAAVYGIFTLGWAALSVHRTKAARRIAGALMSATPWDGTEGWRAIEGRVDAADVPRARVHVRFIPRSGRGSPNRVEQTLDAEPTVMRVRTDATEHEVETEGAMLATPCWRSEPREEPGERDYVLEPSEPTFALVAGHFGRGEHRVRARGPESLLVYLSARPARASLRWRMRAVWLYALGPLVGAGWLGATLLG